MKYEDDKTYTLTGDEPWFGQNSVTLSNWHGSEYFPAEVTVLEIDDEGDVWFLDKSTGYVYIVDSSANTDTSDFDVVSKPEHYNTNLPEGVEVIDIIAAQTADLSGIQAVAQANLIKYALRWQKNNGVEDLKKAAFYLDRLITEVEGN